VGTALINLEGEDQGSIEPGAEASPGETSAIYNLVPDRGYPAEFGLTVLNKLLVFYASVVPTTAGYALRVYSPGILEAWAVDGISLTFFGDPAQADGGSTSPAAFLTNPVDCSAGPLAAKVEADSWENPGVWSTVESVAYPQITGCNLLQFQPAISAAPEYTQADEPSGYGVSLSVPQAPNLSPDLATPVLRNASVTLPEGVSLSPAAADGLTGCQETGPEGINLTAEELGNGYPGGNGSPYDDGQPHPEHGHCPSTSVIGSAEVTTPLLEKPLKGNVFLAEPKCGGPTQAACSEASATNGELYGLYIEVEGSGVILKLKGEASANPATGQLSATFKENPQLPFSELKLHFNAGARAPLANPQTCGSFITSSNLEPWSAPGTQNTAATSFFNIDWDGAGGVCPAALPFAPSFAAGTVTSTAGSFSPFTLTFARHDREQNLAQITLNTPPGLLGRISGVPQCPEAQANTGTCSSASQIGTASVAAGSGSQPFWVTGPVYLTGPYKGAPFGLSVVVPANAGPFHLGNEIVRSAIYINPVTAQLTIVSDPLPKKLDGIPFRLQTVNVTIDKPGFMFNPTNCSQQQITGTIAGAQGASAGVSSPFAVAGCSNLPFKPSFTVSTSGKTSKQNGASLHIHLSTNEGPSSNPQVPNEADIAKVDVQLPIALPSRLTTLQKACTAAQFESNPAGCPEGSFVGTAVAHTPILNAPLAGPAVLVSHGGAAFPDLVLVLQGEGVRIDLVGNTDIKKGRTYSRFETVPDAPVTSFDLTLPTGPHSVLAAYVPASANHSLCGQTLVMPTTIVGQNGAQVTQGTNIAVTGCGKPSIKITKAKIKGNTVLVTVTTSQPGTVTVSGNGLKTIKKTLAAGAHQLKVSLTKNGRTARKHHKKTKVKASVKNSNGSTSKTMTLKL
jgi:hypothetical protein